MCMHIVKSPRHINLDVKSCSVKVTEMKTERERGEK